MANRTEAGLLCVCILVAPFAWGQRDIGVGRLGGRVSDQEESRTAQIAARNDSELQPYSSLISAELGSDIRSARRQLESARRYVPELSVERFLTTAVVSKQENVPTQRVVRTIAARRSDKGKTAGPGFVASVVHITFDQELAQALVEVRPSLSESDAAKQISKAATRISALN